MIPLYSSEEFENSKSRDLLKLKCEKCQKPFLKPKHEIQKTLSGNKNVLSKFCSRKCFYAKQITRISCVCTTCGTSFTKKQSDILQNNFCSRSCSATYYNTHKTKGARRSKLESWIESKLNETYPDLYILYNSKEAIMSELDIYIPSLKLAFELNGIFHYEPIYGTEKLAKIQNNDSRKFQACIENGIELCIIDSSQQTYFKEKTAIKYLKIITNIIDSKNRF